MARLFFEDEEDQQESEHGNALQLRPAKEHAETKMAIRSNQKAGKTWLTAS
jgi:hypothetical protein